MKSFCSKCKTETNQKVLHREKWDYAEESGWWESIEYEIIQCAGCDIISFRKLENNAQLESTWDPEFGGKPITVDLYPNRSIYHLPIKRYSYTPENIKTIYKETVEAYNNNQLILCSGGLRAILEGICSNKKVAGIHKEDKKGEMVLVSNLETKIESLAEQGYLTKGNAEILHNLRFIGNDALHELSAPPKSELKLAINIIEHTIESLYEIEFKAKSLKRKIDERKEIKPKK